MSKIDTFAEDDDIGIVEDIFHFKANQDEFMYNLYIKEAEKRGLLVSFDNGNIIVSREEDEND